jgi:asparagine synthase (glutamine-hydrolysing)
MCGIAGQFAFGSHAIFPGFAGVAFRLLRRRGPDRTGEWSHQHRVQLCFTRLSIIDLSGSSDQPMLSADGRLAMVFNGELYNYRELRAELRDEGTQFRSSGDAEVALAAVGRWGVEALERFNGMFAFAVYDSSERSILIARDAAGIKPVYVWHGNQGLVFGSQLDVVLAHPWLRGSRIDRLGLGAYLRRGFVAEGASVVEGVELLPGGTCLRIDADGIPSRSTWFAFKPNENPPPNEADILDCLYGAVERQLVADVPVGLFLSGGVDSPLVAGLAARSSERPLPTFTVRRSDADDESQDASQYAKAFGLSNRVVELSGGFLVSCAEEALAAASEPLGDYSIIPTLAVCRVAAGDARVLLSGDGGDELFWGYPERFLTILDLCESFAQPFSLRSARWFGRKWFGLGSAPYSLRYRSIGDWYAAKHTHASETFLAKVLRQLPVGSADDVWFEFDGFEKNEVAEWSRWLEFKVHLQRVLLKVDRASMWSSVEVRVPLLDNELIDLALSLRWQSCLDVPNRIGKLPLRRALAGLGAAPTRKKRGFGLPIGEMLRTDLSYLLDELAEAQSLAGMPVKRQGMKEAIDRHRRGEVDYGWAFWILIGLLRWEERVWQSAESWRSEIESFGVGPWSGSESSTLVIAAH